MALQACVRTISAPYRELRQVRLIARSEIRLRRPTRVRENMTVSPPFPTDPGQESVVAFLSDADTYGVSDVSHEMTHGAHVFLAGDKAYKLKRAVAFPFMDFSTLEQRHSALVKEFEVNSATAPTLYESVKPVTRNEGGTLEIDGQGEIQDWVLIMRRFEQGALCDRLAQKGLLTTEMMIQLTREIVSMHDRAPRVRRPEGETFGQIAQNCIRDLKSAGANPPLISALETYIGESCERFRDHLNKRAENGFVRRCHGDLHLRNIVILNGTPTPFDALEFSDDLATGDTYYDLSFLLMDLNHRGLRHYSNRVLNEYVRATRDFEGLAPLSMFIALRASIRAEVLLAMGHTAENKPDADAIEVEANSYLELAASNVAGQPPSLVCIGGFSGTGKSSVAIALAPCLGPTPGAIVIRSDVVRKELFGVEEHQKIPESAYTSEFSERVYHTMLERTECILKAGHSVIVDAVFAKVHERKAFERLTSDTTSPFIGIWLEAPLDERVQRVSHRGPDASDADQHVAAQQETYQTGALSWAKVNASGTLPQVRDRVVEHAASKVHLENQGDV